MVFLFTKCVLFHHIRENFSVKEAKLEYRTTTIHEMRGLNLTQFPLTHFRIFFFFLSELILGLFILRCFIGQDEE